MILSQRRWKLPFTNVHSRMNFQSKIITILSLLLCCWYCCSLVVHVQATFLQPLLHSHSRTCHVKMMTSNEQQQQSQEEPPRLPPPSSSPSPPSFLQALWGIATNGSPWEYMIQLKQNGYDGIVPIQLGIIGTYYFLLNPEVVRAVTVEEATILSRRFSVPLFTTLELDKGIVYEQGDRHKKHKRICIPSFEQKQSMESFVTATRNELDDLSLRFLNVAATSISHQYDIDLYAEMRKSALNVVLDVSFGLGNNNKSTSDTATGTSKNKFTKADLLSKTIAEYLERIVALANEIPPLWQISPRLSSNYVRVTDDLLPTLRSLVAEVIASRRLEEEEEYDDDEKSIDSSSSGRSRNNKADLLGVLVTQFDDNDIRSILFDVVIAGSDTTASTTTAALYILHQPEHHHWLEKARHEAIVTSAGRNIQLDDIRSSMPVIVGVAREVLRLYPPVPFVGRTATDSGSLCNGLYDVNTGDTFCFSPWFLGRDPTNWNDANIFNPQRWIDDPMNGGASSSFSWLPFGAGPRGCLGTRLGLTEVVFGIARLLLDFEFDFERNGPLPVKYDLTLNLDGVMQCNIKPRR